MANEVPKLSNSEVSAASVPPLPGGKKVSEFHIAARIKGPGPAAYTLPTTISRATREGRRAPAYSFGMRLPIKNENGTPGPNVFFPISTRKGIFSGPAFSLQGGYKKKRLDGREIILGPKAYIHQQWNDPPIAVDLDTPGPGLCDPPDPQVTKERTAPGYTVSGRHKEAKPPVNPGPAEYTLQSSVGTKQVSVPSSSAYSIMVPRPLKLEQISPGPAAHFFQDPNKVQDAAPVYSLGSRWPFDIMGVAKSSTPGPGAYSPHANIWRTAPTYSFRYKHSDFEQFVPEKCGDLIL